jgi:selenocysteine-specific elongation factor
VLGTAGHIDHGKTALVRALTGVDLDRLPEEKARGITIELGFAPLDLGDGLGLALVDVPGHERFVRTMIAGASGLDLVLLVVAADEGVMPQTREHMAIVELLGVERGVVALTKADLVDEETLAIAADEVRELLAGGPLAALPVVAASATTGAGIEALRETLAALVRDAPPRDDDRRPARLFVDRAFTRRGFGTVVTGTWSGRPLRVGDDVVVEPGQRRARIRGLERHGEPVGSARSGSRIAVNLQGEARDGIRRGDLLAEPDATPSTSVFDAVVDWRAPRSDLDAPTSVELLCGTAERRARVAPIGEKPLTAGERGFARVHVDGPPLALLPGDRFVLRGFARDAGIGSTLGGGRVLDVAPPRRRRRDAGLRRDLERLAGGDAADALDVRVTRAGLAGTTVASLVRETGLDRAAVEDVLARLEAADRIVRIDAERCLSGAGAERLAEDLVATLDAFHRRAPRQPGMPRAALLGALPENVAGEAGAGLLERLAERGDVTIREQTVSRSGFAPELDARESRVADALRERLSRAGLEPPAPRTLAEELDEEVDLVRDLGHYLEREGVLVAAPDELFFDRASVLALIERVVAWFDTHDELDTQTLKAMIGGSRRTAMPLMALLDDLQITRREGPLRRLRQRTPRW